MKAAVPIRENPYQQMKAKSIRSASLKQLPKDDQMIKATGKFA